MIRQSTAGLTLWIVTSIHLLSVMGCQFSEQIPDGAIQPDSGTDIKTVSADSDTMLPDINYPDIDPDIFHPDFPIGYPKPVWSVSCGSETADYIYDVAVDAARNIYVVGRFGADPFICQKYSLKWKGNEDGFIVKLDSSGKVLWAISIGGVGKERIQEVTVDSIGQVYIVGAIDGASSLGGHKLTSPGVSQGFVARLSSTGKVDWAVPLSVQGWSTARAIDSDQAGNLCITGGFSGKLANGSNSTANSIYVARLNSSGSWLGAGIASTTTNEFNPWAVAVASSGSCLVGGAFKDKAKIGKITLTAKMTDGFVAKMASNGKFEWARSFGGIGFDRVYGLAPLTPGDVVVTGAFNQSAVVGATTLVSNGMQDALVALLDNTGKWGWVVSAGGPGVDWLWPVRGQAGNIWAAGMKGDSATLGGVSLPNSAEPTAMIAKMNKWGKFLWADAAQGTGRNYFNRPVVDSKGGLILAGGLNKSASFRGLTAKSIKANNLLDTDDVWIVKLITRQP